jgi:hypothetical protein
MAHYKNVTAAEMDAFLTPLGFKVVNLKKCDPNDRTTEIVYSKRVDRNNFQLSLRVYTGIVAGESREVGADAMRATLFLRTWNPQKNGWELVCLNGSKRVHRVENWQKNLKDRLDKWDEQFKTCPTCGLPLMLKKARSTGKKFLGCTGFNKNGCRYSEEVPK